MKNFFKVIFYASAIFAQTTVFSQTFEWAKQVSYSNISSYPGSKGTAVKTDSFGNVYAAGFNAPDGIYIVKLDPTGTTVLWTNTYTVSSVTSEYVNLEIDANNEIIVQQDNGIRKYDQDGNLLWQITNCSGTGLAYTFDFTIDPTGNIYLVGTFNGVIDFNPSATTNNQTAQGNSQQMFVQKLNSSGNYVSVYRTFDEYVGGANPYLPFSAILFDIKYQSGKVFVIGNAGSAGIKFTNSILMGGPFLLGLNSNCTYNFANKIGFNCPNLLDAKLCLSTNGFVNVVAKLDGTQVMPIDFDPGAGEALVGVTATNGRIVKVSYTSSGDFIDVNIIIENWGNRISNFSVATDSNQNYYFSGSFVGTVDFNPDLNTINNLIFTGGKDIFIAKYNETCVLQKAVKIGQSSNDFSYDSYVFGNQYFLTGNFNGDVDFNFDPLSTFYLNNGGAGLANSSSGYVLKLNLCPETHFVNAGNDQSICQGETLNLNGSGAYTYTWNNNVINNVAFSPTQSNDYIVTGTDTYGCQDSDTVIVTVNSNSSSQLTQTATGTYTLNGQTYSQSGIYTQVIPNANGCDSTITLNLTINSAGINEVSTTIFNIYPNPAENQFHIDYDGQINKLEIIDAKGAIVYTAIESKEEYMLPNHIQMGYYLVVIHTHEGIFRKELLIGK